MAHTLQQSHTQKQRATSCVAFLQLGFVSHYACLTHFVRRLQIRYARCGNARPAFDRHFADENVWLSMVGHLIVHQDGKVALPFLERSVMKIDW